MDKQGKLFEAQRAEFFIPPILTAGAQGSRRADPTVGRPLDCQGFWPCKSLGSPIGETLT